MLASQEKEAAVSNIKKAEEQIRLALEQGKVTFRIGDTPLLYLLPVHAKGDPLAKGLQFGSREALPDRHIRLFVQDDQFVVLLAEQSKEEGTKERHRKLASVPLSVLKYMVETALPQMDRRLKDTMTRTVGILPADRMRHHGIVTDVPFFFRLGPPALPFSKNKGTRFECDSLVSPPRVVRGDEFCEGMTDAGLVIVKRPDGLLTTPVVTWPIPDEHAAVVVHVSLHVAAMRIGMELLRLLKPYLTEDWLPEETEWPVLVRETARHLYWYPRVLQKKGFPIADLLGRCLAESSIGDDAKTPSFDDPTAAADDPRDGLLTSKRS